MTNIKNSKINMFKESLMETIWPTRCVICDKSGHLLCNKCMNKIKIINQLTSCEKCGEPYAYTQCCSCSQIKTNKSLLIYKNKKYYFSNAKSFAILDEITGQIITAYKDAGERRLAGTMAYFMYNIIPCFWLKKNKTLITYIPSSKNSIITRGFDHCKLLAIKISKLTNIKLIDCLTVYSTNDQRQLNRTQRNMNTQNKFSINTSIKYSKSILNMNLILIDDVFTTGSTLNHASKILKLAGFRNIYCLTFARTF